MFITNGVLWPNCRGLLALLFYCTAAVVRCASMENGDVEFHGAALDCSLSTRTRYDKTSSKGERVNASAGVKLCGTFRFFDDLLLFVGRWFKSESFGVEAVGSV